MRKLLWASLPNKWQKSRDRSCLRLPQPSCFSKDNIQACVDQKIAPLIALGREAHHLPLAECLKPDELEPETNDPLAKMAWKLKTQSGRALYGKRKSSIEPVFGIIKQVLRFRQFSLRDLRW